MPLGLSAGAIAAIGAGASAAATIGGSILSSKAAGDASSKAIGAQQAADAQARADLAPYNTAGQAGLTASSDLLGLNGPDAATAARANFQASPGYQWAFTEGLRGVDHAAAAKGILNSGDTLKAEQRYGAGLADQEFGQYYNRLFSLANLGENAAAKTGANAVQTGQGIASTDLSLGSADTSIYSNAAKGIGTAVNSGLNNYQYNNRLMSGYPTGGTYASLDPTGQSVGSFTSQPDSYYLPGGGGFQV